MKFVARSRKAGACAYAACHRKAGRIYEDENWRMMACCDDHAHIVFNTINQFPADDVRRYLELMKV